jgi:hypothetical protein
MPVNPAVRRQNQENCEFEGNTGYIASPYHNDNKKECN